MDLLLGIPQMKRFRHVDKLLFETNKIRIHQKYPQDIIIVGGAMEHCVQSHVYQSSEESNTL